MEVSYIFFAYYCAVFLHNMVKAERKGGEKVGLVAFDSGFLLRCCGLWSSLLNYVAVCGF